MDDFVPLDRYLQTPLSAALQAPLINRSLGHCVIPSPLDRPIVGAGAECEAAASRMHERAASGQGPFRALD
ncbi:hypothetical protein GCM10027024_27730 [Microbacterium insulae]